jgi:6-phospho-beta-glucosidase
MKIAILGGGGVRTPIVIYGLAQAQDALHTTELVLFDIDQDRLNVIARLGREVLRGFDNPFEIRIETDLLRAAEGSAFVLSSIRVGGMSARARDERIAIEHGLAGQETTGPGGAAMALRTLPVTLAHAQAIERVAPRAWFINFTNPAGLITQALTQNTALKVIGICDTPSELFHAIATGLGEPQSEMSFDYTGLNHLGWIRRVHLRGEDIIERILDDTELLRRLYPGGLFDPELIQALRLVPTEYLFFYYSQRRAYQNQLRAGASRGEELSRLNTGLFEELSHQSDSEALASYRRYLMRRNSSYMWLEAQAGSAFAEEVNEQDPFETATGYHRIALELMQGLVSDSPREVVLNVLNGDAISDLRWNDVVEVPCKVDRQGARPKRVGALPDSVRGLVQSVKEYERTLIQAALTGSIRLAELAMLEYPIIGQWELAKEVLQSLCKEDGQFLGYLR